MPATCRIWSLHSRQAAKRCRSVPHPCRGRPDLADIKGLAEPKRALEIAAAAGLSLMLLAPPGSGKSVLTKRLPGLQPALTEEEALESAAVLSLGGRSTSRAAPQRLQRRPGLRALRRRTGPVPLPALEALREPLQIGCIQDSAGGTQLRVPGSLPAGGL